MLFGPSTSFWQIMAPTWVAEPHQCLRQPQSRSNMHVSTIAIWPFLCSLSLASPDSRDHMGCCSSRVLSALSCWDGCFGSCPARLNWVWCVADSWQYSSFYPATQFRVPHEFYFLLNTFPISKPTELQTAWNSCLRDPFWETSSDRGSSNTYCVGHFCSSCGPNRRAHSPCFWSLSKVAPIGWLSWFWCCG